MYDDGMLLFYTILQRESFSDGDIGAEIERKDAMWMLGAESTKQRE